MNLDTARVLAERNAKRFWVSLVICLLGIQLSIGYVAIRLAGNDPSVAIVPDYHEASLHWDEHKSAISAPSRLGLVTDLDVSRVSNANGSRAIVFAITGDGGVDLSNLEVTAMIYHHARASNVQTLALLKAGDGRFMTNAMMPNDGIWQVNVTVVGAAEPIQVMEEFSL
jgi:nitrogen fixation protein FixH